MHDIRPFLPELFEQPGNLLYIGARVDAHSWLEEFIKAGHHVSIVEAWEPNILGLTQSNLFDRVEKILEGDIQKFEFGDEFDYIIWWHGPEHLSMNNTMMVLSNLSSKARKLFAIACPYGFYPQSAHNGNPFEEHKSTLYPTFFELLGMQVKTDGLIDMAGSEIVAWVRKETEAVK